MKTLTKPFQLIFFCIVMAGSAQVGIAQKKSAISKDSIIKSLVDKQQYVFYAQNVTPMGGRQRFLTSDYTVYIAMDTIISDLPYFGRAYSAPINPSDGGIKFTSTSFDYNLTTRKKGGWNVTVKTKDVPNSQQLTLTIFENGTASLQAISTNRQVISFYGYIKEKK